MDELSKIVAIGHAAVGAQSALMLKKLQPDLDVTIIREEKRLITRCATPYICSGNVLADPCYKDDKKYESKGIHFVDMKAEEIDTENKRVKVANGEYYSYDKLILGMGGEPAKPPIPGFDLEGVFTLRTAEDAANILHWLNTHSVKKGLILGGGAIGVETAYLMATQGVQITLVEMLDHILQNALDPDMSGKIEKHFAKKGIGLKLGERVNAIKGNGHVTGAVLGSGEEIDADFILVSAGVRPRTELAQKAGLEMGKLGLKVNSYLQTSDPDIYAAGDLIEYPSQITGKPIMGQLRPNAAIGGRIIARNILGAKLKYPPLMNSFATEFFNKSIAGTGFTEQVAKAAGMDVVSASASTVTRHPMIKDKKPYTVKLVFNRKDNKVIGGQIVSDSKEPIKSIDTIAVAIRSGWTALDLTTLRCASQPELSADAGEEPIVTAAEQAVTLLS